MGITDILAFAGKFLAIILLLVGMTTAYLEMSGDDKQEIIKAFDSNPLEAGAYGSCFLIAYNYVTASYQIEWIGNPDTKIFMLEDIPLPDSFDVVPIGVILILLFVILKYTLFKVPRSIKTYIITGLMILLFIILCWVALKLIMYALMVGCGSEVGLTSESINIARNEVANKYSTFNLYFTSILITMFTASILAYSMFGKNKND